MVIPDSFRRSMGMACTSHGRLFLRSGVAVVHGSQQPT